MKDPYEDILHLPHHVSATRPQMSMLDRAAQFSPFAALTGYDAAIRETGRLTDGETELDVDGIAMLNEKIRQLSERQEEHPEITVTYFVPDERKAGGAYVSVTGRVRKIDLYGKAVLMEGDIWISFHRIRRIDGELFQQEP